jgi:peptidoglycan hydrolase CwlO-like protein
VETITIILAVLTPLCTIAAFLFARSDASRKRGKEDGEILNEVKTTRRMVEDIKASYDKLDIKFDSLTERVTRIEESSKQAHKRIDEIKIKTAGTTAKE